ncbi:metallophosphoesterase family protein [Roseateles puraquae]|uniref:DNA repair exonuclease n=1 Tax=Roseateles puraquae TaxID=431059 RepID=A0A254N6T1_9BURK|nr:metallophosphoesterase family protein [Roseateles puraquae]MDG0853213.1 metallophosphoesterase [Roseateles puraquae]OWR03719.1 DNA repair exonuclease [Roseateles puraquae]
MSLVLQISDTHFGTERPVAVAALQALCEAQRPQVLLVTGDITQRARPREFAAARACFDALPVPTRLVLPGNHDIPLFDVFTRAFDPYRRYAQAFGRPLEGEVERDDLLLLAVNTTRRWRHVHGEVSPEQIERVAARMAQGRPGQLKLVAVHQPVAAVTPQDQRNLLRGCERAVQAWAAAGVDAVVGGHIHLPYVLPLQARWPALLRPMWAVQAGTALSRRVRDGIGNSVNLIHTGAPARVERWDLDEAAGRFTPVAVTRIGAGA